MAESWKRGELPLWEPRILCGMPLLAQTTSRAFYPTALAFLLASPAAVYAWTWLLHLVLGGLFMYRLARRLGATEPGALLANAAFVLSGYVVAHVHHPMIYFAAVWTLPALECTHALVRPRAGARPVRTVGVLALSVALSWFAGFSQASVLLCYLVCGLAAFLAWAERKEPGADWRRILLPLTGIVLGTGVALVQILPALELAAESSRQPPSFAALEARALSPVHLLELVLPGQLAAPGEIVTTELHRRPPTFLSLLLVPDARLAALRAGFFNHTETALGFGIWPLLFALATVPAIFRRGRERVIVAFLWTVALAGLCGATALPGLAQVLHALPGIAVGDFRRLLLLPAIALPLLAALGFRAVGRTPRRIALVSGLAIAALGVVLASTAEETFAGEAARVLSWGYDHIVSPEVVRAAFAGAEAASNQGLLARGLMLLGAALALGPLFAAALRRPLLPFLVVTAAELIPIAASTSPAPPARGFDAELPELRVARSTPPARLLRVDARPEVGEQDVRFLPPNLPLVFGLADACGYGPLPPARAERFYEALEPGCTSGGAGVGRLRRVSSLASPLAQLLAVDRVLTNAGTVPGWTRIAEIDGLHVFAPPTEPIRCRLYFDHTVSGSASLAAALTREGFDPARTAVIGREPPFPPGPPDAAAEVELVEHAPGRIRVRYESASDALLFVSEGWDSGWRYQSSDGSLGQVWPLQGMFLGVPVRAGRHEVTLYYEPDGAATGSWLSLLFLLACAFCLAGSGRLGKGSDAEVPNA